jgi:thymidine kinase
MLFKPAMETRYSADAAVTHDGAAFPAEPVSNPHQLLLLAAEADVVALDEAQFFPQEIVSVANRLADMGKRVIAAGLDLDYQGNPFGPMPYLLATAEFVTKLHAICTRTGQPAHYSHRRISDSDTIRLGAQESYEPLSRQAFCQVRKVEKS